MSPVAVLALLASGPAGFGKPQKKSAASNQQQPEAILGAAKKFADAKAWNVQAHVNADKDMKISGIIFGKDFDLTTETIDGTTRQITLGDKSWSSNDGGKSWKENKEIDRRFYYLMHTPIKYSANEKIPPFAALGTEKLGDESLLHIRFIAPDKITYEGDRSNYWIAMQDPKSPVIHRFLGPMGFENDYVTDQVDYTPNADEHPIVEPPGNPHAQAAPPGPEALLMAATKNMSTGVWSVNGTVEVKKTIKLQGLLSGKDFDLTMEPGTKPDTPMRLIVIKDKAWVCSDGETWHAGSPNDRLVYNWAHIPIMSGRLEPAFEQVGTEQRDGQMWLHIKLKVAEAKADPKKLPQYWLVLDPQGQAQYIGRAEMPMFSRGANQVIHCSFDYAPAKQKIQPPPLGPPVDDKAYGFNDIEQHKFEWKDKIIRLEVTPKILESRQIGEDTYRGFFKDTATPNHYGVVEFPYDALVKLGFLKKIVSGAHAWEDLEKMGVLGRTEGEPVSFYVQVIPIGEKPAARGVAVGAKLVRDPDGSASYTWETGEKQAAKSSPAPAASDASDGDLVNRGIEKAKNGDLNGAIADFNRAIELNPKDDAPYYNRAQAERLKKDTAGAIADYTRAIELGSTNPAAYNNRGNARAENNDWDGAIADYTRAIKLKPDYARAYYNRAMVKKDKGDAKGAAADFKKAAKLDPNLASEESAAESKSNRPLSATPTSPPPPAADGSKTNLVEQGIEKGKQGDLDGALADFNRAIELDPKNALAYYNRAYSKKLKKDAAGAIADYTRAIELNPKFTEAYFDRGNLKGDSNDPDGAIADYNRAIELKPDYALAYYNRGVAKKRKGDAAGAEADLKSAAAANVVSLLDGKLKIDLPPNFSRDPNDPKDPKTLAEFSGPDGAWGTVLRGTHGLTPEQLDGYLKKRVAEYSKGFKWLPKDSHLQWLKKQIVTIDGRNWADWSFVPVLKGKNDYSHNPVYTRNLTTSYKGQLLEINFSSNLNTSPELKKEIDHIMDSVHLEE
jgi:tetratricopeptide (TPR) repeat protein